MIIAKVFDVVNYRFVVVEIDDTKPFTATRREDLPGDISLPTFEKFDADGNPVLRRTMINGEFI